MQNRLTGRGRCTHPPTANVHVARAQTAAGSAQHNSARAFEWDLSAVHAFRARQDFIESIRNGEASADLARAAVASAAEDDAIGVSIPLCSSQPPPQLAASTIVFNSN
jgi:hypothetical protein